MAEPGGLPSMGLHRVGHDWSDLAAAAAVYIIEYYSAVKKRTNYLYSYNIDKHYAQWKKPDTKDWDFI